MTLPLWLLNKTHEIQNFKAEVTIVGGGFVGLSIAYWLTELNPELKIILVERLLCGSGASGRNAGFLTKGSALFYQKLTEKWREEKALAIHGYAKESLSLLAQHILGPSQNISYESAQSTTLMRVPLSLHEKFGFDWKEKYLSSLTEFTGAYVSADEYMVQPLELLEEMKNVVSSRGVRILEGHSAFKLSKHLVETSSARIETGKVILAINGYAGEFHPLLLSLIRPYRAQMLAVDIGTNSLAKDLFYDPAERVYFRKQADDVLIIGGKRLLDEAGEVGTFEKLSPLIQEGLEHYLAQTLKLRFKVVHRWSGIMGFTQHELPYVEEVEAPTPTFIAAGFSGHGMGFGFHAAKETAELVTGRREKSFFSEFHREKIRL